MWSGFTGYDISPWQVHIMMLIYKIARMPARPEYQDNYDDARGYLKLAEKVLKDEDIETKDRIFGPL